MIAIKEFFNDVEQINEMVLAEKSDELWKIGSLAEIKTQVSTELFALHVYVNLIGNWKEGGWWFIFCEMAELIPYVSEVLEATSMDDINAGFEKVLTCFPENTVFVNDENYCDTVNFLQNPRFKVTYEKLRNISVEERKELAKNTRRFVEELDETTEAYWGDSTDGFGWKGALDYIFANK